MGKIDLIAGEPLGALVEALVLVRFHHDPSGRWSRISGDIPNELAEPVLRALRRIGDELSHAAKSNGVASERTPEQIMADAFVELYRRIDQVLIRKGF
jgi:hypothetical protein